MVQEIKPNQSKGTNRGRVQWKEKTEINTVIPRQNLRNWIKWQAMVKYQDTGEELKRKTTFFHLLDRSRRNFVDIHDTQRITL